MIRCQTVATPASTTAANTRLWTRLSANIIAITRRRSNLSARYPVNGVTRTRGIIAAKVTSPTQSEESERSYTSQPRATISAQEAAPADRLPIHKVRKSEYASAAV